MNEDLRGLSGLMRDKGFTRPQGYAPGGAVMQAPAGMQAPQGMQMDPDGTRALQMQAPQGMAAPPMARAPAGMQMDPDQSRSLDMRARQEMQKAELMGQLVDLVGSANPEVVKMLENAPVSELMKAVQEIQDAGGIVKKAAGGPIRYFKHGGTALEQQIEGDADTTLGPPGMLPPPPPPDLTKYKKYAQDAIKMSQGTIPVNLEYDFDGDGQVTLSDSGSFLRGSTGMMGDDFNFEIANPARYQQDLMEWAETNELDVNNLSPEQIETAKADYATYQTDFDANKVDYYGQPILTDPDPVTPLPNFPMPLPIVTPDPPPPVVPPPPPPPPPPPVVPPPPPPPPPVVPIPVPPPPPPPPPLPDPVPLPIVTPDPPVAPGPPPPPPVPVLPPPPPPIPLPPPLPVVPGPPPVLPVMPPPPTIMDPNLPFSGPTSGNPFAGNMAGTANDPYGITQARPTPNPISGPQGGPLRRPYATTQNRYLFGQRQDR